MTTIAFAMIFEGSGQPVEGSDPPVTRVEAKAQRAWGSFDGEGAAAELARRIVESANASFESEVVPTGEGSFDETGTIDYGGGNRFSFSTVGEGQMGPAAMEGVMHGAVSWRVEKGEGAFEGATGLITSNFVIDATGNVTDYEYAVLHLPG